MPWGLRSRWPSGAGGGGEDGVGCLRGGGVGRCGIGGGDTHQCSAPRDMRPHRIVETYRAVAQRVKQGHSAKQSVRSRSRIFYEAYRIPVLKLRAEDYMNRITAYGLALIALAEFASAPAAQAWGCKGHQTVALIAEKHLTPEANQMVQTLL